MTGLLRAVIKALVVLGISFLAVIALMVMMCATAEKPGEGPTAAAGYRWGAPVIAALEDYRRDHRRYPDNLSTLSPLYLAANALAPPRPLPISISYRVDSVGYSLTFFYTGPASNHCTYTPSQARWRCSGAW